MLHLMLFPLNAIIVTKEMLDFMAWMLELVTYFATHLGDNIGLNRLRHSFSL